MHTILFLSFSFFRHTEPTNTKPFLKCGEDKIGQKLEDELSFCMAKGIGRTLNGLAKKGSLCLC